MFYVFARNKRLESASKVRQIGLLEGSFEMLIQELHWDYDAQLIVLFPLLQWDKEINLFGKRVKWIRAKDKTDPTFQSTGSEFKSVDRITDLG